MNTPPRGTWTKKEEAPPSTPRKPVLEKKVSDEEETEEATSETTKPTKGEKIDDVLVHETYVDADPETIEAARALSPKTAQDAEAVSQRKAIISDSWEFYRLICGLVSDRDRYNAAFLEMQKDPVYPYLNSLTSVNDPGYIETENFDKVVLQKDEESYAGMSKLEMAKALEEKAKETLPEFLEICKSIAGALSVEELGIGPIKEAAWAMRKAQRKYDGDLLKVTDYCRVLLIVDDFAALLGLLELVRDSYGELVRRVKLSTLKRDQKPKVGGYRDCIINMEVNEHICELQVHLRPLWNVCGADGYKHYVRCMEYKTDSFKDSYASLKGLDRKSLRELIALADDITSPFPLDNVTPDQEKVIMDYFALAGLYYKAGSYTFGEIHFSRLFELRKQSFGPLHPQVTFLCRYLAACLRKQGKKTEAKELESSFAKEKADAQKAEKGAEDSSSLIETTGIDKTDQEASEQPAGVPAVNASASFWDGLSESFQQGTNSAYDLIMDPNRKVREQEESARAKIKASKQAWRAIRRERYPFLEGAMEEEENETTILTDGAAPVAGDEEFAPVADTKVLNASQDGDVEEAARSTDTPMEEATPMPVPAMEHVEEKKEDGEPPSAIEKGDAKEEQAPEEEEVPSTLDRLMENACSLCTTNTTASK